MKNNKDEKYSKTFEIVSTFKGKLTEHRDYPLKRFGISQKAYPNLDIMNFTQEYAKVIYYHNYWMPAHSNDIPYPLCILYFETAVDAGKKRAIKLLQMMLNNLCDTTFDIDGEASQLVFITLNKHKDNKDKMIQMVAEYLMLKLNFYYRLSSSKSEFETCILGWSKKIYKFWRICFSEIFDKENV